MTGAGSDRPGQAGGFPKGGAPQSWQRRFGRKKHVFWHEVKDVIVKWGGYAAGSLYSTKIIIRSARGTKIVINSDYKNFDQFKEDVARQLEARRGIKLEQIMHETKQGIVGPHWEDLLEGVTFLVTCFLLLAGALVIFRQIH